MARLSDSKLATGWAQAARAGQQGDAAEPAHVVVVQLHALITAQTEKKGDGAGRSQTVVSPTC